MKLYTEEQVKHIVHLCSIYGVPAERFLPTVTPQESPTWDDVAKAIKLARELEYFGSMFKYLESEIIEKIKGHKSK